MESFFFQNIFAVVNLLYINLISRRQSHNIIYTVPGIGFCSGSCFWAYELWVWSPMSPAVSSLGNTVDDA